MIYKRKGHWHLDVTMHGVRYREALETTDKRASEGTGEKTNRGDQPGQGRFQDGPRVRTEVFQRSGADLPGRAQAARRGTNHAIRERASRAAVQSTSAKSRYCGSKRKTSRATRRRGLNAGISGRTVNMETGVLRRMLKRAKVWNAISEDVRALPERQGAVGKVLPADLKRMLFETAASKPEWTVAHCAAVLAVSTTCRGVEIKNLRWQDVDLFSRVATIRRSKTAAGHRTIPLNGDAMAALARLLERARAHGSSEPEHYVFPTCEHLTIDPTRPQKSWRTAWRKLVAETARRAGREAAREALESGWGLRAAIAAWKRAAAPFQGLRFHDLRHQAITEMAETGASDATLMAVSGHMSRRMLEHYSHVRMAAKRTVLDKLESGLMGKSGVGSQIAEGRTH